MLKTLTLHNLILVKEAQIDFGPGFNVLTGETGSGKTALIEAIRLCLGARADTSLIRKAAERAIVEMTVDIDSLPNISQLLEEGGIDFVLGDFLIIKRELTKEGKSKAFINCQTVPLPFLQKIGSQLIDLIDQSAHYTLRKQELQREILDRYSDIKQELTDFQFFFQKEKKLKEELQFLNVKAIEKEREEGTLCFHIEEIESLKLEEKEEEELFQKVQLLSHSEELNEKIGILIGELGESEEALIPQLARLQKVGDSVLKYDPNLNIFSHYLKEASIALKEAFHTLQSYSNTLDHHPQTLQALEQRLNEIARIKRKYGNSFEKIQSFYKNCKEKLSFYEQLSEKKELLEQELKLVELSTSKATTQLTQGREKGAKALASLLTSHLKALNMPGAIVSIQLVPQERTSFGDELIQFWIQANPGENPSLVKDHASGGEVCRLLFAIKTALAEKNHTPTLIFDEIDANVGGQTASLIGKQLKELGNHRQVICITHFPQVAAHADTHFAVRKIEEEGRTLTQITSLTPSEKPQELLRMLGGAVPLLQETQETEK